MRKTVFVALIACGLVVSLFVGTSMSQEPVPAPRPKVVGEVELKKRLELEQLQFRVKKLIEMERLNVLIELQQLKIPELQNLERLETDPIAEKKLMQAVKLLAEVTNHFPDSNMANQANEILEVWKRLAVHEKKDKNQDRKPPRVLRRIGKVKLNQVRAMPMAEKKMTMAEKKFEQALKLLQVIATRYPTSSAKFRARRMVKEWRRMRAQEPGVVMFMEENGVLFRVRNVVIQDASGF